MESDELPLVYKSFPNIIGIVFNNWTAIKLAVEHGMAGPPNAIQRKLTALVEAVMQTFSSGRTEWNNLSDMLADLLDLEFDTVLEDNSSDEVAVLLCDLYQSFLSGDTKALMSAMAPMPNQTPIHYNPPVQRVSQIEPDNIIEETEAEVQVDDGWTVVKKR